MGTLKSARMSDATQLNFVDDDVNAIEAALRDIFGITADVDTANALTIPATGDMTVNRNLIMGSGKILTLDADPTANLEAATKQYVDANGGGAALTNYASLHLNCALPADGSYVTAVTLSSSHSNGITVSGSTITFADAGVYRFLPLGGTLYRSAGFSAYDLAKVYVAASFTDGSWSGSLQAMGDAYASTIYFTPFSNEGDYASANAGTAYHMRVRSAGTQYPDGTLDLYFAVDRMA